MRTSYTGYRRGLFGELVSLAGLVTATALACNFHELAVARMPVQVPLESAVVEFVAFAALFLLGTILLVSLLARWLGTLVKRQQPSWLMQWGGVALGAARGMWWAGVVVLMLLSGAPRYVVYSIWDRSLLGRPLAQGAARAVRFTADWYPGHGMREQLIPGLELPTGPVSGSGI